MSELMYRYLEKYVGTYRVKAHYCLDTCDFPKDENGGIDPTFEDLYIDCSKGEIRHSYKPYTLVWFADNLTQGRNIYRLLLDNHKVVEKKNMGSDGIKVTCKNSFEFVYDECGDDVLIWFNDKDINKIAEIVKPRTAGKSIPPFAISNLPAGDYTIPEGDLKKLNNIYKSLSTTEKMHFMKNVLKKYDDVIVSKKSKKLLEARKESGLKPKEYIHYIGMWKDFLKFVKEEYDNR